MNKTLKSVLGALVLVIVLAVFYLLTFQLSEKRLVIKETTNIVTVNDLSSSKMNKYYKLYEKVTQKDTKEIKEYTKHIKGLDVIYFNEKLENGNPVEDKEILAVNLGWAYPIAKFKQKDYFNDLGKNYFELKPEYEKELVEKYGFKNKIYMTNYKGYYFLSDDVMKLSDYLRLLIKKDMNKNITAQIEKNSLGEFITDLSKSSLKKEDGIFKLTLDYDDGEVLLDGELIGDKRLSGILEGADDKTRKFESYMGENRIYLTSKDFKELTLYIEDSLNAQIKNQLSIVKMLTGKNLEDYTDEIDGELVYDYEKNQLILPLKNTDDYERILGMLGHKVGNIYNFSGNNNVEIKDNILYYNGEMEKGNMKVDDDSFLNASINLGMYSPKLLGNYVNIDARAEKDQIKIKSRIKEDELIKVWKLMEEERND